MFFKSICILSVHSLLVLLVQGNEPTAKDNVQDEPDSKVEIQTSANLLNSSQSNATASVAAVPSVSSPQKKKRELRMSKLARQHLSDENNPNNFPKALGIDFPGCVVHALFEKSGDLMKLVQGYGTDADLTTIQELAQGFDALQTCSPEESYEIFDAIIQHFPEAIFAYIGRGLSLGRLANKIKASSECAMKDLDHALKLQPHLYLTYRCRAEVHFLTGRFEDAMKDAEKDNHYKPDGSSYVMMGILSYKLEKDHEATQLLAKAHKFVNGHNAVSYEFLGLAYLNMGMLRKSGEALKNSLEYEEQNLNVLQTLGNIYSELGDANSAHYYLDMALELKADDVKTIEAKGHVYYSNGNPKEALKWYKSCLIYDPTASNCAFMKAVSAATIGQFYNAVKSMTKVMLSSECSQEYREPLYLRDFYRYLNKRLDTPLSEYRYDDDLPEDYRYVWANKLLPNHFNYTEQSGIEPNIKDVEEVEFSDLTNETKVLLCKGRQMAHLFQYRTDGFMPNSRSNLAMAMASLNVAQVALKYWQSPKSIRGWKGRHFSWRDLFEVAVKWRKLVSMDQPLIWLDQLPKRIVDAGFVTQILLKKGLVEVPRYSAYTVEALQLAKFMIRSLLGQKLPAKAQDQVMKASSPTDILQILKKYDSTNPNGGFTVGMQVPSLHNKGQLLHGVMLSLVGQTEEDITLSIQSARTSAQINQYHVELSHVFNELRDDVTKKKTKDTKDSILQLVYYFYNLIPLSRGTSAVAYSVAMGLFIALNKEISSSIPRGKQPDIEAYFAGSAEAFAKKIRGWLSMKSFSPSVSQYPSVNDVFYSSRVVLEALNVNLTDELCRGYDVIK